MIFIYPTKWYKEIERVMVENEYERKKQQQYMKKI